MVDQHQSRRAEGRVINDIVKEYPNMLKVIIYHNGYILPRNKGGVPKEIKQRTKQQESIHRSLRRSKTTIKDIMLSNRFDLWCTFTYNCRNCRPKCTNNPCTCSPSTCERYSINYTRRVLQNWFRNQRTHSPDLKYLAVPEYHKNGAIHFHCMLAGFNGRLRDSGKKTKHGQTIYNAPGYYSGFTEFVKIGERFDTENYQEDYNRVINYITKYITKDMPLVHGRQRFLVSEGLIRPKTTVNGVTRFNLHKVVKNHTPEFINDRLEVQKHNYGGTLAYGRQGRLF